MKKYIISLLFITIGTYSFGQIKLPMYCGKYVVLKDSAFVDKQLYKLDKVYKRHRSYVREDSTLVIEQGGDCFIKLFTNIEFKEYMHITDSIVNFFKVYPPIIEGEITYSDFIDYIKVYLPKLDSMMSINYSEMSNCIYISNILDKQVFLGRKQITPLMYEYKHKFDSTFNLQAMSILGDSSNIRYFYIGTRTYQFEAMGLSFADQCNKAGYIPKSKDKNHKTLNIYQDLQNFYKTCPIKYEFLMREGLKTTDIQPISLKYSAVPLFFFISSSHNQVISGWPNK